MSKNAWMVLSLSFLVVSPLAFGAPSHEYRPSHGGFPECRVSAANRFEMLVRSQFDRIPLQMRSIQDRFTEDSSIKSVKSDLAKIHTDLNREIYESMKTSNGDLKQHRPELVSVVEGFLNEMEAQYSSDPEKRKVLEHLWIEFFQRKDSRVNLVYVLGLAARFLAATSDPSDAEKEVYAHVLNSDGFEKLVAEDAWKKPEEFFFNLRARAPGPMPISTPLWLNEDIRALDPFYDSASSPVSQVLHHSPIQGKNFLSPITLTAAFLKHKYPVVMPFGGAKLQAHGIGVGKEEPGLSAFGHFFHDLFHAEWSAQSGREAIRAALLKRVTQEYEKYLDENKRHPDLDRRFNARAEVEKALSLVQKRYEAVLHLGDVVLDALVEEYLCSGMTKDDRARFQSAVTGFFLGVHEFPVMSADFLDKDSPTEIIQLFCEKLDANIRDPKAWESSDDPLETSPFNGQPKLDDAAIKEKANSAGRDLKEIKRSKRFFDVTIGEKRQVSPEEVSLPGGEIVFTQSFPTLFHRLNNSEDSFKLMKYAGKENYARDAYQRLTLAQLREAAFADRSNREATILYLEALRGAMHRCVEEFKVEATQIIQQKDHSGKTLEKAFQDWASALK